VPTPEFGNFFTIRCGATVLMIPRVGDRQQSIAAAAPGLSAADRRCIRNPHFMPPDWSRHPGPLPPGYQAIPTGSGDWMIVRRR
jgi:hypothetical protein